LGHEPMTRVEPVRLADQDKPSEIYQAAARIFYEKGYHATSINEIADAVHLTKAGLYYYIKGKQDLLYQIMDYAMDMLEREVVEVAKREKNLELRLRHIVRHHALLMTQGSSALAILVNEIEGLTDKQKGEIVDRQRAYIAFIRVTLEALAKAGRLHRIDPTTGAFGLLGMILWISRWYRPDGPLSANEVVDQITELALSGLLNKP
jgi:AcrR family transcriptional regulator